MDDDSRETAAVKWGLGILGLGAIAAAVTIPKFGIWVGLAILLLAVLLFGGYYLWRWLRQRRQSRQLTGGVTGQAGAVPKTISDPKQRAELDDLRQKFLAGLQVFKSRGKDIYKLPWFVIIGESGSGKTEAIRNSGIDFPPGMQDELQGSGGTINMDWWFTNQGIIVDTAGKMIIPDDGDTDLRGEWKPQREWVEFLRLLHRNRPHCPINGLMLVLSTESLIKDSADKIARKASRLAQQLDLIQRTLDVRFPVYLLVTKCDLMEGFREFSDNITDPLLQHQMFGWSNPDPLDEVFRPELVEQFLKSVADRVRRRRLALLREAGVAGGGGETQTFFRASSEAGRASAGIRRTDAVNSVFALPESIMRLAPRLRRYLETIFVAGEWSAKPIFLRGIYFTSSMRKGSALDEALALATNVSVDELPESDRSESRAFFLRDLFNEKIFREGRLVTRATNTLKMLRQRRLAIFGAATVALLLLLGFAWISYRGLRDSMLKQTEIWSAGTNGWTTNNLWLPGSVVIRTPGAGIDSFQYSCAETNLVAGTKLSVVAFHRWLLNGGQRPLAKGVFRPVAWLLSDVNQRPEAQRLLFEDGILKPLVDNTRMKMTNKPPLAGNPDSLKRQRGALLSLMGLEADKLAGAAPQQRFISQTNAERYLRSFVSYLIETNYVPDTNLVDVFVADYSKGGASWPPASLLAAGGDHLSNNPAIDKGLDDFGAANKANESRVLKQVQLVNELVNALDNYAQSERGWLNNSNDPGSFLKSDGYANVESKRLGFLTATNPGPGTNLASSYAALQQAAEAASTASFSEITTDLQNYGSAGIFIEIDRRLKSFSSNSVLEVKNNYLARSNEIAQLDRDYISPTGLGKPVYQRRHNLYQMAFDLTTNRMAVDEGLIGNKWQQFGNVRDAAQMLATNATAYDGPLAEPVRAACDGIAGNLVNNLQGQFLDEYVKRARAKLLELKSGSYTSIKQVTNAAAWLARVETDLQNRSLIGPLSQRLNPVADDSQAARQSILDGVASYLQSRAGFPVLIDSAQPMNAAAVHELKDFLTPLTGELQQGIWLTGNVDAVASLRRRCDEFGKMASRLADAKGEPINGTLYFVPGTTSQDMEISGIYRGLKVSTGRAGGAWEDVNNYPAAAANAVANGTMAVDAPLQITFCKNVLDQPESTAKTITAKENWGLIRLLRDYKAVQQDDPARWRFFIPLSDDAGHAGKVSFEIKFDQPLPKMEDWPRQQ